MSDFNSSLPVRTQNNGDVVAFLADGTTSTQLLAIDASGRLSVKLSDGAGNAITSQTNGTQKALDVGINVAGVQVDPRAIRALTSADVVTAAQGTAASLSGAWPTKITDGTTAVSLTGSSLNVNITGGAIDVGTADKSAFTYGTSVFQPVGGVYQDTSPSLASGTSGAARLTANRALHINLRDASGNEKLGAQLSAASIPVVIASDQAHFPVEMQDGAGNAITSQANGTQRALDVGINVAGVQVDPRSIRALTSSDIVTAAQGAAAAVSGAWPIKLTDGTNIAAVKAASTAAAASDPSGVVALSPNSPLPAGSNAIGSVLANLQVASAAVSSTNPVPVTVVSTVPGSAVQSAQTSASLAAAATANLQYTVTSGKTLALARIFASSSGKIKAVVGVETGVATGTFTTKFVGFNSTAMPNIDITVVSTLPVAAGVRVQVAITNLDKQAMDVYATIEGTEN